MSSPPPDPAEEPAHPKPLWYSYWPKWRRLMLSGAVILLIGALIPAIQGETSGRSGWVTNASLVIGYVLLAYGFVLRMRERKR